MGNGTIDTRKRPPMPLPPRSGGGHRASGPFRLPHTVQIATLNLGIGDHLRNPGFIRSDVQTKFRSGSKMRNPGVFPAAVAVAIAFSHADRCIYYILREFNG
jgi:hypothetical protein